ncbi:hypothetical protein QBC33DRAFT_582166 [Phialemonium atrogriseum]|uniref:PD-(D/E)XK nuclease-like domain-containing protein n=1 Tax=Phialemonium atrogriseum TaxID=1093897 RepID=A0AAJ0BNW2_9PEZI|nr:uncharacterized protein QBC33DRAFT_582166 [Phialemonium atrogriseum]KAK1761754.1 hypothetical protein QBC33DRAFT_582166 [Phialemonium atrogriseum]
MPTPPSSDEPPSLRQSGSPSKRRRVVGHSTNPVQNQDRTQDYVDLDRTPRSSIPTTNTSKQRRSASPTKNTLSLQSLEKAIHFIPIADNAIAQLPSDVHALYNSIADFASDRIEILPHEKPQLGGEATGMTAASRELEALGEIESAAKECLCLARSEPSWNEDVHKPLLKLALSRHRANNLCENVTTARVAAPFALPGRAGDRISKMVDYTLDLSFSGPASEVWDPADADDDVSNLESMASLSASIRRVVGAQPIEKQTVNPTRYAPLIYAPVAASIETKAATGSAEEGRTQLGVWTAARHEWMKDFVRRPVGAGAAAAGADEEDIVGHIVIGDTGFLLGLYSIVSVLRAINDWICGSLRQWITHVFSYAAK